MTAQQQAEPEFTDTDDRPAWWHRRQWLSAQPDASLSRSKPKYRWSDPRRINIVDGDPTAAVTPRPPTFGERFRSLDVVVDPVPVRSRQQIHRIREWSPKYGKPHTYLVAIEGSDLVKIGATSDPMKRMQTLQVGMPMDLYLLWSVPGEYEAELHRRFAEYRHRGEWFDLRSLGDPVTVVTDAINEIRTRSRT